MTTLLQSIDANGVATLTLNRPDKRNALDYELIGSLKDALEGLGCARRRPHHYA